MNCRSAQLSAPILLVGNSRGLLGGIDALTGRPTAPAAGALMGAGILSQVRKPFRNHTRSASGFPALVVQRHAISTLLRSGALARMLLFRRAARGQFRRFFVRTAAGADCSARLLRGQRADSCCPARPASSWTHNTPPSELALLVKGRSRRSSPARVSGPPAAPYPASGWRVTCRPLNASRFTWIARGSATASFNHRATVESRAVVGAWAGAYNSRSSTSGFLVPAGTRVVCLGPCPAARPAAVASGQNWYARAEAGQGTGPLTDPACGSAGHDFSTASSGRLGTPTFGGRCSKTLLAFVLRRSSGSKAAFCRGLSDDAPFGACNSACCRFNGISA